jgi:hypothetical protein
MNKIIKSSLVNMVITVVTTITGCLGTYLVSNNLISTTGLGCTMIYCSQWEDYLFHNIDSMYQYKINYNQLTIYSIGTYNLNFVAE